MKINLSSLNEGKKSKKLLLLIIGGSILVLTISLILFFVLRPTTIVVAGRVWANSEKTIGLSNCNIYIFDELIDTTNEDGTFRVDNLQNEQVLTFSHTEYNFDGNLQFDHIVNGTILNLEIIATRNLTEQERLLQKSVKLSFVDENENEINSLVQIFRGTDVLTRTQIGSTSNGTYILNLETQGAPITISFNNLYYDFSSKSFTNEHKGTEQNCVGEFKTDSSNYLVCTYRLTNQDGTAFIDSNATVFYSYYNLLTLSYESNTLVDTDLDANGTFSIVFNATNETMFEKMSIFVKDELNSQYWFATNIVPSASSVVGVKLQTGYLVAGTVETYVENGKIYLENGGYISASGMNFWFVSGGELQKLYSNANLTNEIKVYRNEEAISVINQSANNYVIK